MTAEKKCWRCDGHGRVTIDGPSRKSEPCPDCGGLGTKASTEADA